MRSPPAAVDAASRRPGGRRWQEGDRQETTYTAPNRNGSLIRRPCRRLNFRDTSTGAKGVQAIAAAWSFPPDVTVASAKSRVYRPAAEQTQHRHPDGEPIRHLLQD